MGWTPLRLEGSFRTSTAKKEEFRQIVRVGLDLATYVFEVHGVDAEEKVILRKTSRREAVATFFAERPSCLGGMEACSGTHDWAKALSDLGHEARLMSAQFVTPYVTSNKNDRNDAEACLARRSAGRRCGSRRRRASGTTPQKSSDQLALPAVHRIRQRLVSDRTRLVNQIRGLLAEHGIAIARDISRLRRALTKIVEGDDAGRGDVLRELVRDVREDLTEIDRRIGRIEGIGPVTATTLVAAVGDRTCFRNGRAFGTSCGTRAFGTSCGTRAFGTTRGLVPRQRSSGGKARLLGISKRGDRYIRTLTIHGARAVLGKAKGKSDVRSQWIARMRERRHPNVVAVARANNAPLCAIGSSTMARARIVRSVLASGDVYRPARTAPAA